VTIWIYRWRMNTLVTWQYQSRISSITKIFFRRIRQSDWNIQIKLNYLSIFQEGIVSTRYHRDRSCVRLRFLACLSWCLLFIWLNYMFSRFSVHVVMCLPFLRKTDVRLFCSVICFRGGVCLIYLQIPYQTFLSFTQ
jgi:hypothetical protein